MRRSEMQSRDHEGVVGQRSHRSLTVATPQAALGFRAHSGWAVMVAVTSDVVILRERVSMVRTSGERAGQPYHAAESMKLTEAEAFLARTEKIAVEMAAEAVRTAVA